MTDEELAAVEAAEAEMLRAAIKTVTAMALTGADPDAPRNYVAIALAGMRAPFDRAEVHLIRPGGMTPHEARVEADAEVRRLRDEVARERDIADRVDAAALSASVEWDRIKADAAALPSCNRARRAAEEEVAALKAEVAAARLDATNARQVAEESLDFHEALRRTIGRPPTCARTDDLWARLATPDPAAFVAAVDAYGEAARRYGVTAGNGEPWERLCADKEKADAARAALLALGGVR